MVRGIDFGAHRKQRDRPWSGRVQTRHSRGKRTSKGPDSHVCTNELCRMCCVSRSVGGSCGPEVAVTQPACNDTCPVANESCDRESQSPYRPEPTLKQWLGLTAPQERDIRKPYNSDLPVISFGCGSPIILRMVGATSQRAPSFRKETFSAWSTSITGTG